MAELGDAADTEHRAIGAYAATRADAVIAVGPDARLIATGAGDRATALPTNAAAADWLRSRLAPGDVVLVKASRAARLDEVAEAIEALDRL
nr:hypothetical protein GCM10025732_43980 [Glycomyces mayteni]